MIHRAQRPAKQDLRLLIDRQRARRVPEGGHAGGSVHQDRPPGRRVRSYHVQQGKGPVTGLIISVPVLPLPVKAHELAAQRQLYPRPALPGGLLLPGKEQRFRAGIVFFPHKGVGLPGDLVHALPSFDLFRQ